MQTLTENNAFKIKSLHLILVFAILQFIVAYFTDWMTFTHEEAMWHYIGRNWLRHDLVPYAGGVDNKSPLIFYIFGISDWLFGVNLWFPKLAGIIVQSVGILYLFKIAEKMVGRQAGFIAIIFYGLSLLWHSTGGKYVSFTETYSITCIIIAVYLSIVFQKNKYSFISGLFAGLGLGFRFSAIFGILPVFINTVNKSRKSAIAFLLGLFTCIGLLILLILLAGININDFFFFGFTDNFGAGSPTDHSLAWKAQRFADSFFYSELILFYPAVVCYFILVRKLNFLKGWLFCEFIGIIILGIYAHNHFKNLLPALSLISAIVVNHIIVNYHISVKKILLVIWIIFFPKTFEPLFGFKKFLKNPIDNPEKYCKEPFQQPDNYTRKQLGLWIKSNTMPEEKVLIAGMGAHIQVYSERLSPSIYFNLTQTKRAIMRFINDVTLNKPSLILVPKFEEYKNIDSGLRTFIDELIAKNYHFINCKYGYSVYKINK
jgi:hypothetical protein